MPVPVKARPPAPATPTTTAGAPEVDVARPPSPSGGTAMARTTADVVRARTQVGNAAVTTALGNLPAGAEPNPAEWAGRMLLAGQDLVGNQVVAKQAAAAPAVPGRQAAKKPEPAAPTRTTTKAPPAPRPELPDKRESERPGKGGRTADAAGPRSPGADPEFQALKKDVGTTKRRIGSSHPPATAEAGAAQAASVPPADDREARGKAAHAEDMDAAKPKEFDRRAFVKAVEDAIAKRAPKNLDEADKFGDSGKADEVKAEVQGEVAAGKEDAAREIADTTAAVPEPAPDAKEVVPLAADKVPGRPGTPNPDRAAPDALPPSATDMSAGPAQVKGQMDAAGVTERQLSFANSREPGFDKAVKDKKALDAHSETAPGRLRAGEAKEIKQVKRTAAARGAAAMTAMHATRVTTGKRVGTGKQGAKSRDEDKRAVVTKLLQDVFDKTKGDVEKILTDLDKTVDEQFTTEEKRARKKFTEEHTEGMREYKSKRYAGLRGKARWFRDLFAELPEEANQIYVRAKDNYLAAMRGVIGTVADTVERELRRAKDRIATGRKELKTAVDNLPKDLKAIGREAASEFEGKFDELTDSVDEKGTELVDTLATRYTDAVKAVDEEIAAEKEKNKNFFAKAADAIGGAIKTIKELGRMLMGVLRKAASAVGLILRDPVGFLGNLITGVGGGLKLFMRNAGRHLQQGVLAWLLGTGVGAGLQLPTTFDVLGILVMIAGLLGLSWPNLRARLARKVDPRAMAAAETGADAIPIVVEARKRGVAGLWSDLKSRVGDLKKELISKLVSYLLPTIIIAGVTWIVSLFNPASAFIRACKMIIDIIRFIVTQGRQIIEFVNTVLDAVIAIARGGTGGVPALVERALARSIPVLIGALAAILGIGGIAGKVKQVFQSLARPVNRAIDWVLDKITALLRKLWAKLKARMDKRRKKPKDTKKPRQDERPRKRRDDDSDKSRRLRAALSAAVRAVNRYRGRAVRAVVLKPLLLGIRLRHRLRELRPVPGTEFWSVYGAASPGDSRVTAARVEAKGTTDKKKQKFDPEKEFASELNKAHEKSRPAIIRALKRLVKKKQTWAKAKETVRGRDNTIKQMEKKPLLQEHKYGDWTHDQAAKRTLVALNEAKNASTTDDAEAKRIAASLRRFGSAAIGLNEASKYLADYKNEVHKPAAPFNSPPAPVELFREAVWDGTQVPPALDRIQETMLVRVKMGADPAPQAPLPVDDRKAVLRMLKDATLVVTTEGETVVIGLQQPKADQITGYLRKRAGEERDPDLKKALAWWEEYILKPDWHHAWPQWLGGEENQTDIKLPRVLHHFDGIDTDPGEFPGGFHQILNAKIREVFPKLSINDAESWIPYRAKAENVITMGRLIVESYEAVFERFKAKKQARDRFVKEAEEQMGKLLRTVGK